MIETAYAGLTFALERVDMTENDRFWRAIRAGTAGLITFIIMVTGGAWFGLIDVSLDDPLPRPGGSSQYGR